MSIIAFFILILFGLAIFNLYNQLKQLKSRLSSLEAQRSAHHDTTADSMQTDALADSISNPSDRRQQPEQPNNTAQPKPQRTTHQHNQVASDSFFLRFFRSGNSVIQIGAVILLIGIAFLLKLTINHGYFPLQLRIISIVVLAAILFGIGLKTQNKRPGFGHALQGIGIGMCYLVSFAAYHFYQLISAPAGIACCTALSLALLAISYYRHSAGLASIAVIGGFLAPIIIPAHASINYVFYHYVVLNLMLVVLARLKPWRMIQLIGFLFTYIISSIWSYGVYGPDASFATFEFFIIVNFICYLAIPLCRLKLLPDGAIGLPDLVIILALPALTMTLQCLSLLSSHADMALSAACFAVAYFVAAWYLKYIQQNASRKTLILLYTLIGIGLFTCIPPLLFSHVTAGIILGLEAVAFAWAGARQEDTRLLIITWILQVTSTAFMTIWALLHYNWSDAYGYALLALVPMVITTGSNLAVRYGSQTATYHEALQGLLVLPTTFYLLLWSFFYSLIVDKNVTPLSYIAIINIIDLSIILVIAACAYNIAICQNWHRITRRNALVFTSIIAFIASNTIIIRALTVHPDFYITIMNNNSLPQMVLSIYWAALALILMLISRFKQSRLLWFGGATLIGLVVLKLFFFDLSTISAMLRVITFIGVGGLLILIGYLSPLPPKERT